MEVIERAKKDVRCECGALLRYTKEDVIHSPPSQGVQMKCEHISPLVNGGWPHVRCPECRRAVLVSGVL